MQNPSHHIRLYDLPSSLSDYGHPCFQREVPSAFFQPFMEVFLQIKDSGSVGYYVQGGTEVVQCLTGDLQLQ